jgi:serine/threonine protein kinase
MAVNGPDSFPLREVVTLLLAGRPGDRWRVQEDDRWCMVTPYGHPARVQGWKLHVSASWLAAPVVLHRAARVLVERGCAFKFAATLDQARELTSKDTDRAQAGKFLTAYPRDDDQLRELARLLDQATAGLPGPAILSDRRLRPGSLVHYRYGAFAGAPVLTNDGARELRLEAPDGALVEDVREPWFCPPPWAELPFEGPPGREPRRPDVVRPVLLGKRFRVTGAIRHSARGGVYRAVDQQTGQPVVIKQARAHIGSLSLTGDARDGLRYEEAMLAELAGLAPERVLLFEDGPHLFLAVAQLPGQTLGSWLRRWFDGSAGDDREMEGPPLAQARATAAGLADLVGAVHARGLVFRDLSPDNVMVLDDGTLRLVDAELVARPGEWVSHAHTPGFGAPEVLAGPLVGPAPGPAADHYALGVLLCHLLTGMVPAGGDGPRSGGGPAGTGAGRDRSGGSGTGGRPQVASLLGYAGARNPAARRLTPAVSGLTAGDPCERWDTGRLRAFLAGPAVEDAQPPQPPQPPRPPRPGWRSGRLEPERQRRLLEDGLAHLVAAVAENSPGRLVTSSESGSRSDACNVQHGAAGVLAVLVRGSELVGGPEPLAAVRRAARWIDRRRTTASPLLPGLYFGRSGTAWALYAAARQLDDEALAGRALELAGRLPVRWPNPDVTHGTAGAGLASLHLWYATKEPWLWDRVHTAVDHLLEHARSESGQTYWQVAPDLDSKLAGLRHYGFAHGVAGIGAFLLAAAQATGRDDALRAAGRAGDTLAGAAIRAGGAAYWPTGLAGPDRSDLRHHWCSGASGVGTFLLRLWLATGEVRHRDLAHEAAVAVRRSRWLSGVSTCHGLAGNGEFLLDLADAAGGPYRHWAEELAACLYLRSVRCGRRLVVLPDPAGPANLDFGTGLAGVVGYLLRLRYGGPRWWMADPPGWPDRRPASGQAAEDPAARRPAPVRQGG